MRKRAGAILFIILFLLGAILAVAGFALAGDGDGSGGGKNNPLAIVSSIPADGAPGSEIWNYQVNFSKNVSI